MKEVNSEVQALELKGNQNNTDLNLQGKLLSNHDETSAAFSIEFSNCCPDSIHSQVNSNAEILRVDNLCSTFHNSCSVLIEPCDTLYANKFHHVQLITCAKFFKRIYPTNCLSYTIFDQPVEINEMLDNVSMITSTRPLNYVHSFKLHSIWLLNRFLINYLYVLCA
jgi:hypothetical protein